MKQGFVKVAALTPKIKVADPIYNAEVICNKLQEAYEKRAKIIVLPELCIASPDIPAGICSCRDFCWSRQRAR